MLRLLALSLGVALIVLLGFLLEAQSQSPAPPRVEPTASAKIFAPGRVEGATQEIELRPQIRGQIISIPVREGDIVQPGDVLMQLDPRQFEHEVELAKAEIAQAEAERERLRNGARDFERAEALALHAAKLAELEQAQVAWNRLRRLRVESAVSQQELDDQHHKVRSLEAQVQAAHARAQLLQAPAREDELLIADAKIAAAHSRMELAKVALDRTVLRAMTAGQVLRINKEPGELAGPDSTEPVLVLADTSRPRVRAFVEELDAPRVQLGMTVTVVADGLSDRTYTGRITHLSPRMSAKQLWTDDPTERHDTKSREILIDLDHADGLVMGLRVDVVVSTVDQPLK